MTKGHEPMTCPICGNPQPDTYFCETCMAYESLEQQFARFERKDREHFVGRRKPLLWRLFMWSTGRSLRRMAEKCEYVIRARPKAVEAYFKEGIQRN